MRRARALRTGDLTGPLGITPKQERELFTRLAKSGLIAKVRRGLYLVPSRLPLGAKWTPDEALALTTLMADCGGRYQVCGPNAFNRYGFSNQVPQRVYAYNNRLSEERTVGIVVVNLIKVADARLGDVEEQRSRDGYILTYSSRPRTLIDAVYDWSHFNTLLQAYAWIRAELAAGKVTAPELTRLTLRYGNFTTVRRMGALLEILGAGRRLLSSLERAAGPMKATILMAPRRPAIGV